MFRRSRFFLALLPLLLLALAGTTSLSPTTQVKPGQNTDGELVKVTDKPAHRPDAAALSELPLAFVENRGQWDTPARFVARQGGLIARFESEAMILQLEPSAEEQTPGVMVRLAFESALDTATLEGDGRTAGTNNYFLGNDPAKWRSTVPAYRQILYGGLYDGIDLRVREGTQALEYDLLLAPGADLKQVVIRCEGIDGLAIDPDGTLVMETALGAIRQPPPTTWQERATGERQPVASSYRLIDGTRFGFDVPARDPGLALVIDPEFWSTCVGGQSWDDIWDLEVDGSGDVIATGGTFSPDFPTTPGSYDPTHNGSRDAFVFRMAGDGSGLLWSTFVGAGGTEVSYAVSLETSGRVTIAGRTDSPSFPTTPGAFDESFNGDPGWDAFVTRLDATGGSLVYSTFVGGAGWDWAVALASDDASGEVVLAGYTQSLDFPTTPGAFDRTLEGRDAYVARLNESGSALVFSSFLGGSGIEGLTWEQNGYEPNAVLLDLALAASGSPIVCGYTWSSTFPTTPGVLDPTFNGPGDIFVTRFDPTCSALENSTFLGSTGDEGPFALDVDELGNVTVGGVANSGALPTTPGAYDRTYNGNGDCFLSKLDADLSTLLYSSFLGSTSYEWVLDLDLHDDGSAVMTGVTYSSGFPTTPGCFDPTLGGGCDAFLCKLTMAGGGSGDLEYSTFIGGNDCPEEGLAVTVRGEEVTLAGYTASHDFPVTHGAGALGVDGFICRFHPVSAGVDDGEAPAGPLITLGDPTPNPAFGPVYCDVGLEHGAQIRVSVYDSRGRLIRNLIDRKLAPGSHRVSWDPDDGDQRLPSGAYYLRLNANGVEETRKVLLMR